MGILKDIFGDRFDFGEYGHMDLALPDEEEEEDSDEEEEEDSDDEEEEPSA